MLQVALNTINQTNKPTLFSIPHCGIENAGSTVVLFDVARQALSRLLTHNMFINLLKCLITGGNNTLSKLRYIHNLSQHN
jgi:hypothetical protein